MESKYHYFKRDISWLSFNYRVLLEADDDSLPLYERINTVLLTLLSFQQLWNTTLQQLVRNIVILRKLWVLKVQMI